MTNLDRTNLLLNEFISNNDEMNKCIELAKAASANNSKYSYYWRKRCW